MSWLLTLKTHLFYKWPTLFIWTCFLKRQFWNPPFLAFCQPSKPTLSKAWVTNYAQFLLTKQQHHKACWRSSDVTAKEVVAIGSAHAEQMGLNAQMDVGYAEVFAPTSVQSSWIRKKMQTSKKYCGMLNKKFIFFMVNLECTWE